MLELEIPSKSELNLKYSKEGSTISSLARHYNVSNPTIRKWLRSHKIIIKSHAQASKEANNRKRNNIPDKKTSDRDWETL